MFSLEIIYIYIFFVLIRFTNERRLKIVDHLHQHPPLKQLDQDYHLLMMAKTYILIYNLIQVDNLNINQRKKILFICVLIFIYIISCKMMMIHDYYALWAGIVHCILHQFRDSFFFLFFYFIYAHTYLAVGTVYFTLKCVT